MDFRLTEEQSQIAQMVRDFALSEIKPHLAEWDEAQHFPVDTFKRAGELGMLGVTIPEEYGGAGLSYVDYVNVVEELAVVDSGFALSVAAHNSLGTGHIYLAGNEEQKKKWLPKLTSGEWIGAWGLTEPGSGSDASGMNTVAVKDGSEWVLNGTKNFITNGPVADVVVLFAMGGPDARAISTFLVPTDTPGLKLGPPDDKLGIRGAPSSQIFLEDCTVPADALLGQPGQGFKIAMRTLDGGRIGIGAQAVGIARAAFEDATHYALQRKTFGHPIAEHQAIQFKLADMSTEIDAARLLVWRAAVKKDAGLRHTTESSMAKLFASEVANRAAKEAVQVFGGYGYLTDFPVERHFRDAKITEIYEGTSEIQRLVIASALLKD